MVAAASAMEERSGRRDVGLPASGLATVVEWRDNSGLEEQARGGACMQQRASTGVVGWQGAGRWAGPVAQRHSKEQARAGDQALLRYYDC